MNAKRKIVACGLLLFSTFSVVCGVVASSIASPRIGAKGTPVVDTWYEKAYIAPTATELGYKHYYLGCPGNYRTLDADHNVEVTLADISIANLDILDKSLVTSGSEILNIDESNIKYCDQATNFSDPTSGGTATFVRDQGHQAIFFSRSNNLGDGNDSKPTEFRFAKTAQELKTITFDYRYLDYNTTTTTTPAAHIFMQTYKSAYTNYTYEFVNDDLWHSATISIANDDIDYFIFKIVDMQGHLFISNLHYDAQYEAALKYDGVTPITISDLDIQSGTTIPSHATGHIMKSYDYVANKGIDLWFKPQYTVDAGQWFYIYLFNQDNEDGIVFRFDINRTEDDGIISSYIYTVNEYGPGTTAVRGAGNAGTFFWYPRACGVTSSADVRVHIYAYCIDETTNTYRCSMTMGVAGGTQYYPKPLDDLWDGLNTERTFDIELGSSYFNNGAHRRIRFSSSVANNVALYDATSEETLVVFKDSDGNVIGKNSSNTVALPTTYSEANKTFVGWYDQHGQKVTNGQTVTSKTVVQALAVANQDDMIVPSTLMMDTHEKWYEIDTSSPAEVGSEIGYKPTSGNRIDLYYIYEVTGITGSDNWTHLGFPYDMLDGNSRAVIRINENGNGRLDGYVSGGSLGQEGAEGTYFNISYTFRKSGDALLIHLSLIDNGNNSVTLGLEFTNIRTRETGFASKNITFNSYDMNYENGVRNKICAMTSVGCSWRFTDAF